MDERLRRNQLKASETTEISEKYTLNGKLRKKYSKRNPSDENTTTSQAVLASTRPTVKGNSKKINYDALKVGDDVLKVNCTVIGMCRVCLLGMVRLLRPSLWVQVAVSLLRSQ